MPTTAPFILPSQSSILQPLEPRNGNIHAGTRRITNGDPPIDCRRDNYPTFRVLAVTIRQVYPPRWTDDMAKYLIK
jgi:hypothetical protein